MAGRELLVLTTLGIIDEVFSTLEFVSLMSFHAQVSDPILGGVYMTLLNSGANFGGMWPESTGTFTQINILDSGPGHIGLSLSNLNKYCG